MANLLFHLISESHDFEAFMISLSIVTFRYVPQNNTLSATELNVMNEKIMATLQNSGKAFLTNAVIHDKFLLRACFVNFRTREEDVRALPGILRGIAQEISAG
jgi:glutamate/tyrosine decarboxylase-like PLP-dependent enzyme